jgi:sarcosine oxidase, subunit beta
MIGPLRRWRVRRPRELRPSYDVVIIGGGVHGLAIAYELARRGVRDVAVLEKAYIGAGGSGRNTAIVRSNYRTPEGVAFYDESVRIYEGLSVELGFNVLFSQHGHLTFAHTDSAVAGLRVRAEVNQLQGVDSVVIERDEIRRARAGARPLRTARGTRSLPPSTTRPAGSSATMRWSGATRAGRTEMGVHIHQGVEVTGIDLADGRIAGVQTSRGSDPRRDRRERDGRLGIDDRGDGRRPAADRDAPAPGARHRAAQAVPRTLSSCRRRSTCT